MKSRKTEEFLKIHRSHSRPDCRTNVGAKYRMKQGTNTTPTYRLIRLEKFLCRFDCRSASHGTLLKIETELLAVMEGLWEPRKERKVSRN